MKRLSSALLLSAAAITTPILSAGEITLKQGAQKVDVHIDGQHFTSFHFKNVPKPVLKLSETPQTTHRLMKSILFFRKSLKIRRK